MFLMIRWVLLENQRIAIIVKHIYYNNVTFYTVIEKNSDWNLVIEQVQVHSRDLQEPLLSSALKGKDNGRTGLSHCLWTKILGSRTYIVAYVCHYLFLLLYMQIYIPSVRSIWNISDHINIFN